MKIFWADSPAATAGSLLDDLPNKAAMKLNISSVIIRLPSISRIEITPTCADNSNSTVVTRLLQELKVALNEPVKS